MRMIRWCWLAVLVLCAAGCASNKQAGRAAASGSAAEQRAQEMEAQNEAMRAELSRKQAELRQSFSMATQAEETAGLRDLGCVGVMPASTPAQGLPRSGAPHAQFTLSRKPYRMTATFSAPRTTGAWRVSQGTCKVVSP